MDRYAYYVRSCKLERRQPLDAARFRFNYETRFRWRIISPESSTSALNWAEDFPDTEVPFIESIVSISTRIPAGSSFAGRAISAVTSMLGLNRGQTAPDNTPNRDRRDDLGRDLDGGVGTREPRRPVSPLLSGSAARAYPPTDPPRWWAS